jgi:hypothetical protein
MDCFPNQQIGAFAMDCFLNEQIGALHYLEYRDLCQLACVCSACRSADSSSAWELECKRSGLHPFPAVQARLVDQDSDTGTDEQQKAKQDADPPTNWKQQYRDVIVLALDLLPDGAIVCLQNSEEEWLQVAFSHTSTCCQNILFRTRQGIGCCTGHVTVVEDNDYDYHSGTHWKVERTVSGKVCLRTMGAWYQRDFEYLVGKTFPPIILPDAILL